MTAEYFVPLIFLLVWAALCSLGGIWIVRSVFTLRDHEIFLTGVGVGLVLENWAANLAGQLFPLQAAVWIGAATVFLTGLLFSIPALRQKPFSLLQLPIAPLHVLLLLALTYAFFLIGSGLAILDDYQNLPTAALIAAGDIPPHLPLNPQVNYGYHYFTLLLAAQLSHLGDLFIWTALDLARALGFSIAIVLTGLFVRRVTGSKLAGMAGGFMTAFGGGTRWLLLLLPSKIISRLGESLSMLGSGLATAPDLATAMSRGWAAAGLGPLPFPFAFVNGIHSTGILTFQAGYGGMPGVILGVLLLCHNKWRDWRAGVVIGLLMASFGLANEVLLIMVCGGLAAAAVFYLLRKRTLRLPVSLQRWLLAAAAGGVLSLFQGGVLTALVMNKLAGWFPSLLQSQPAYHTFSFSLFWPPKVLSAHLGYLSLVNPSQLLIALAEIGPILLLIPLVVIWMIKAFRTRRWFECSLGAASLLSLLTLVVQMNGASGITALTRVQAIPLSVLSIFGVPALWMWARRRPGVVQSLSGAFFLVLLLGGFVLFGISLIASSNPVPSYFLERLDASMSRLYFDRLEKEAFVFDSNIYRSPVVFGRPNASSISFYETTEEWRALKADPDPYAVHAAGYDYMYMDKEYWTSLTQMQRDALNGNCVRLVHKVEQPVPPDYRKLLDLSMCD